MHTLRRRRGLTIVEIMVVIAILGILMTVLGGNMFTTTATARSDLTRLTMAKIDQGLQLYAARSGRYPSSADGLDAASAFMPDGVAPLDTWGCPFEYHQPSPTTDAPYQLVSRGADCAPGGTGPAADIYSDHP